MRFSRLIFASVVVIGGSLTTLSAQPEADVRAAVEWLFKAGNYSWEARRSHSSDLRPSSRPFSTDSGETQIDGYTTMVKWRIPMVILGDQIAVKTLDGWAHGRDIPRVELSSYGVTPITGAGGSQGVRLRCPHEELEHLMGLAHNFRKEGAEIVADLARTFDEFFQLENYMRGVNRGPPWSVTMKTVGGLLRRPPPPRPLPAGNSAQLGFQLVGPTIEEFRVEIRSAPNKPFETKDGAITEFTTIYIRKLSGIGRTRVVVDPKAEALLR